MEDHNFSTATAGIQYIKVSTLTLTTVQADEEESDWEESKSIRRTLYYTLHGVVGLMMILCNGFLLYVYKKRAKVQKHTSFIMLNAIISCFVHGWIVGILWPLHRVYRYKTPPVVCVLNTLIMDWADRYVLILLPFLAIERLVYLKFPFIRKARTKRPAIITSVAILVVSALYTWLPLIPAVSVPEATKVNSNNSDWQQKITRFYYAYSCQGKINKKNRLEPPFIFGVTTLCVVVVVVTYIWMFLIAKARFAAFPNMTRSRKHKMRKAAISVMLVSVTFIFTLMPYGMIHPLRNLCDNNITIQKNAFCLQLNLELRFIFSIVAHMGNILAPLLFAFLNPHTRAAMGHYLGCNRGVKTICRSMKKREEEAHPYMPTSTVDRNNQGARHKVVVTSYHCAARNGLSDTRSETPDTLISPVDYL